MKNKICLINVKYSDNLGDGLISERMEAELTRLAFDYIHLDLSGKSQYKRNIDVNKGSYKSRFLAWLMSFNELAKYLLFLPNYLAGKKIVKKIKEPESITHVMIGGGHLFSDTGGYFPARLIAICRYLQKQNPNIYFTTYGIGVSEHMSKFGIYAFNYLIKHTQISHFFVRDEVSKNNLECLFNVLADVVLDPALITDNPPFSDKNSGQKVAIGIMSPSVLKAYGDDLYQRYDKDFYINLFLTFKALNYHCSFFTNGAFSDELFLKEIYQTMGAKYQDCFQERFESPTALCDFIESQTLVLSHRLHANIIAFSKGVPSIGFPWDSKVSSFFLLSKRADFFIDCEKSNINTIVERAQLALQTPVANDEFLRKAKQQFMQALQNENPLIEGESESNAKIFSH